MVVPLITTVGWVSAEMDWFLQISQISDAETIGAAVLKAVEHIQVSPVDARTNQEREEDALYRKATKCGRNWCERKSWQGNDYMLKLERISNAF